MGSFAFSPAQLKRSARTNSVRKGLLGGSRFWTGVYVASRLTRLIGKVTKRGEKPIRFSEALKPGETLMIRHIDPAE